MPEKECAAGLFYCRIVEEAAAAISYFVNASLIYLIVFHTPNDVKIYSRLLLCSCAVDCLFTTVMFFTQPVSLTDPS
ncbi:serpentine type 7TM GPCR chemoreceptor str domain-containing protein [Ditylenchus destructor]|nr:serpentine type 7TM GPCR chemoreceptor str domain-containing protein [Ditylenchus destructor]